MTGVIKVAQLERPIIQVAWSCTQQQ